MLALDLPGLTDVDSGDAYLVGVASKDTDLIEEQELCGYFEGVNTLLDYIAKHMPEPKHDKSSSEAKKESERSFHTFGSFAEAADVYRNRPSTVRGFDPNETVLRDDAAMGNDVSWDVTGDFLDVGRYLENEPECFGELSGGRPTGRRVNLLINLSWASFVDPKIIHKRSRRIQRLVDWLENQGVRVAVTAIRATECSYTEILIKDHDQTLDINDVAVVSHGDFLRRILFRFDEHSETWKYGYGSSNKLGNWIEQHPVRPEFNAELNVWIDNKGSDKSIDADFDGLESWMEDRLGKSDLEPKKRYKAVLTKQADLAQQMFGQIKINGAMLPPSFTLKMPPGGISPAIKWEP